MTRFLTSVEVSQTVGLIFQALFVLSTLMIYSFVCVYANRYWRVRNEVSRYEQIMFILVVSNVFIQFIQSIDPFSINGIYSFKVNRIWYFISGSLVSTPGAILLIESLMLILFAINKQTFPAKYRIALYIITTITTLSVFPVFLGMILDAQWADNAYLVHLLCKFIPLILTIIMIIYSLNAIKQHQKQFMLSEDETHQSDINDISATTIEHANIKTKKGLSKGIGQLCFIMIYFLLDLIDGHHVLNGEYFMFGLIFGLSSRFGVITMLRMQWIDPIQFDEKLKIVKTKNAKIYLEQTEQKSLEPVVINSDSNNNDINTEKKLTMHTRQNTAGYIAGISKTIKFNPTKS